MSRKSRKQKARARAEYRARQLRRARRTAAVSDMTAQRSGMDLPALTVAWRAIIKAMRECKITARKTSKKVED